MCNGKTLLTSFTGNSVYMNDELRTTNSQETRKIINSDVAERYAVETRRIK